MLVQYRCQYTTVLVHRTHQAIICRLYLNAMHYVLTHKYCCGSIYYHMVGLAVSGSEASERDRAEASTRNSSPRCNQQDAAARRARQSAARMRCTIRRRQVATYELAASSLYCFTIFSVSSRCLQRSASLSVFFVCTAWGVFVA